MEQQLANVSMPFASIVFDLIQIQHSIVWHANPPAVEAPLCPNRERHASMSAMGQKRLRFVETVAL